MDQIVSPGYKYPHTPQQNDTAERWERLYGQTPLCDVPRHFAGIRQSPFLIQYLEAVLRLCPRDGRTCETGIGSGYGAIWLSHRGVNAEGIDYAPAIVERARQVNDILEGHAKFRAGDLFAFFDSEHCHYDVIHHQGVLEHFPVPQIRAALAQQVARADWVVFSVPSVYYPFEPEFGDERLLPLEEWQRIVFPFDVAELRYYGDPQLGAREQILCVLRGQPVDDKLRSLMTVPAEPYAAGISAVVHTRNEARHIGDCLETLRGWADEMIVCDMESEDETVRLAHAYTENILSHPRIPNFDRARNLSAMRAGHRWVFYLDADERVPPALGAALRELVAHSGDQFEALLLPFRHHFAGKWMQSLYPGYTAPRLLKNGRFVFHARLHAGVQVDGRTARFPADDPGLALVHHSFDSLTHYLDKLNRYTDGEALNLARDGQTFHWQRAISHFVQDFQAYYDRGGAARDGVHGFLYSFLSGFYRFEQHAKLYEHRFQRQQLLPDELDLPGSVEQVLEYALAAARQRPLPAAPPLRVEPGAADVVWNGPLHDPSGYGEDCRHLLWGLAQALEEANEPTLEAPPLAAAALPVPWSHDRVELSQARCAMLDALAATAAAPGFIQVIQNFPTGFARHPNAGLVIGRTMFETDRLPPNWVEACNRMDYVWVPSEFNRRTFAQAGVEAHKLVVIPNCLDPAEFPDAGEYDEVAPPMGEAAGDERFTFLSVFDWTRHKGWDVLLRAFLEEFEGCADVTLVLKVWSTSGYSADDIRNQAADFVRREMAYDLQADARVRFATERLPRAGLRALYRAADAFVLPSRGEGWGRPYMEAMASGRPVIGTNWGGSTAFMGPDTSYLVNYSLQAVPEDAWREVPAYRGHRWAEPDRQHLRTLLRHVFTDREAAAATGRRARADILERFSLRRVGACVAQELRRLRDLSGQKGLSGGTTESAAFSKDVTAEYESAVHDLSVDIASAEVGSMELIRSAGGLRVEPDLCRGDGQESDGAGGAVNGA